MAYEKYNFSDPELDYSSVNTTVLQMYSQLRGQNRCCGSPMVLKLLSQVADIMFIAPFDLEENTERYEADVRTSYKLLYPLT